MKVFIWGFIVFTAGSLLCGAATGKSWLIAARVLQGLGAASLLANANAILTVTFQGAERGFALGLNSTIVAAGYALGYVLGGFLTEYLGWRSIFYVNVPFGILAVWSCRHLLPSEHIPRKVTAVNSFDWKGSFLSCVSLGLLLLGTESMGSHGGSWGGTAILLAGLFLFIFFVISQLSAENPILHLELFRLQNVSIGLGCLLCFTATLASTSFVFPFYLKEILNLTPSQTGLVLAPYSVALCFIAPFTGWLTARIHPGWMSSFGFAVGAAVCGIYSLILGGSSSFLWVAAGQFGLGLAGASFLAPNRVVVLSSVPPQNLGEASALIQCIRFFGLSIGTMMASLVFESLLKPFGGFRSLSNAQDYGAITEFLQGLRLLFPVTGVLLIIGAGACAWNALHPDKTYIRRTTNS